MHAPGARHAHAPPHVHTPQGLGKSLTTITFLHTFFRHQEQEGPAGRALLVVPSNVSAVMLCALMLCAVLRQCCVL